MVMMGLQNPPVPWGTSLFGATGLVVPNDANANVKAAALRARTLLGDLVQICDGIADDVEFNAALNALPTIAGLKRGTIYGYPGLYDIQTTIIIPLGAELHLDKGAVLTPSLDVHMVEVPPGANLTGGYFNCYGLPAFSKSAIHVVPGGSEGIFRNSWIIKDFVIFGQNDSLQNGTKGSGVFLDATSTGIQSLHLLNGKIQGLSNGLYLYNSAGMLSSNYLRNIFIAYSLYPIHLKADGGQNVGSNQFECQIEAQLYTKHAVYAEGVCQGNQFVLKPINQWSISNLGVPTYLVKGDNLRDSDFDVYTQDGEEYGFDMPTTSNIVRQWFGWENMKRNTLSKLIPNIGPMFFSMLDVSGYQSVPNLTPRPSYGVGGNPLVLYNSIVGGTLIGDYPTLVLDGAADYAKTDAYFGLNSGAAASITTIIVVKPNFNSNDGAAHTFFEWFLSSTVRKTLQKTAGNELQLYTISGVAVDPHGSYAFSSGDLLVLMAVIDRTNTKTSLYCNGVLVAETAAVCNHSANGRPSYVGCKNDLSLLAGGDYAIVAEVNRAFSAKEVRDWTNEFLERADSTVKLRATGTATVLNATTSIVVNHGLAGTPTWVRANLTNNPTNDPQVCWADTKTATQFTINTKVDPGATGAIFNWKAQIGDD